METTHGEYYYFSGVLTAEKNSRNSKTILLVDTGTKVRAENVNEGEGGEMIDSGR